MTVDLQASDKVEAFLEHHGIKGMRWGVRKNPSTGKVSGSPSAGTPRASRSKSDGAKKSSGKPSESPTKKMSDQQLRDAIQRLQMEKTYASLTASPPGKSAKVKKVLLEIAGGSAKNLATQTATAAGKVALSSLLRSRGLDQMADQILKVPKNK